MDPLFMTADVKQYGGHMVMTGGNKSSRFQYVNIDTKYADEYAGGCGNLYSYSITFPSRITNIKSVSVCNIEMPMSFYNVSSSLKNNFFRLDTDISGGTTYSNIITIPEGNYTTTSALLTAINAELLNIPTTGHYMTMSLSGDVIVLGTTSSGDTFHVYFNVDENGNTDKYEFKSKLGWMLGFRNTDYTITTSSSKVADVLPFLNAYPKYCYLTVEDYSQGAENSFMTSLPKYQISKNVIAKIVLDKQNFPFGSILPANAFNGYLMTDRRTYRSKTDWSKIKIGIVDENGNPLNLNGWDFSFCVEIELE